MKKIISRVINAMGFSIKKRVDPRKIFLEKNKQYKNLKNIEVIYDSNEYIKNLKSRFDDFVIENFLTGFLVTFNNLKFFIETTEEFFILNEVFIEQDYGFHSEEDVVLVDIGTNIGIASLYFSTQENVSKIYSYEPVLNTFNQAKINFELNKNVSKVVSFNNFGLGKSNRKETFLYNKNIKGNTGLRGKLSKSYENESNVEEIDVTIKDVSEVLHGIINDNPNAKIAIKIDCEGAEYEILENLLNSGYIKKIDILLIEWHDRGAEYIENSLKEAKFNYFSRNLAINSGMVYAIKNEK